LGGMMLGSEVARHSDERFEQQPRGAGGDQQREADVDRPFLPARQAARPADLLHAAASVSSPTVTMSPSAVMASARAPALASNASRFTLAVQTILASASASQAVRATTETEIHRRSTPPM